MPNYIKLLFYCNAVSYTHLLTKLSGVRFIRLTRFVDYTFFKSFVEEEHVLDRSLVGHEPVSYTHLK